MTDKHSQKTFTVLDEMGMNPKERLAYEVRLKQVLDQEAAVNEAKWRLEVAEKQAMERGLERGIQQGIEQGIERGIERGVEQQKITTARNMLKENIDVEVVVKVTGLPIGRVQEIKAELEL